MRTQIITALMTAALVMPAGLLLGRAQNRVAADTPAVAPNAPVAADVRDVREAPGLDEIRRVVREEMARVQQTQGSTNAPAPVPELAPTREPTRFEEDRYHDAEERLLAGLDRGVWNDADAIAFSDARTDAGIERTDPLVTQLILAINDGRIHLETQALPF